MGVLIFYLTVAGQYRLFRKPTSFPKECDVPAPCVLLFTAWGRHACLYIVWCIYNINGFRRISGEPGGAAAGSRRRIGTGGPFSRTSFATAAVSRAHFGYSCVLLSSGFGRKINSLERKGAED